MKKDNFLYIVDMTLEEFSYDQKTQDTVIRQISIIDEAMNKIDTEFLTKHPELPSKKAVSMRNILVHDYDNIDIEKLWKTIKVDLPILKEMVSKILAKEKQS
ncbi:hypothetical protein A3H26_02580 [candidate division WWE3 bacterium RIFCSPLOWO2_12_FULL_36_10]|uniref:DUF86 domain-containing protein n=1 Tax=candidate division WWE3 bacterium RIFCSPLOWO2_12_FULL_36_10 TaxID=1802630 RepID=A0A1F4VIG6_UNCKA|nr:MAG: hypothetical protein A3H26_02580 [candidate division WWE3 bacterium RIFCSPLOWO2_12_FULL_36_10]